MQRERERERTREEVGEIACERGERERVCVCVRVSDNMRGNETTQWKKLRTTLRRTGGAMWMG